MLQQFIEEFPQLEIAQKIRALILKTLVRPVRRFPPLERALARVLNAQGGSNDEHFVQAVLILRGQISCAQSSGRWETSPAASQCSVSALLSSTAPSSASKLIAIRDHPRQGRVKKRKVFHCADLERFHAQNHRRER